MVSIYAMSAVLCAGAMVVCILLGTDPIHGAFGAFVAWAMSTITFMWANAKHGQPEDENVYVVEKKVENPANRKMRKLLDAVQKQLSVNSDAKVVSALVKIFAEIAQLRTGDVSAEQVARIKELDAELKKLQEQLKQATPRNEKLRKDHELSKREHAKELQRLEASASEYASSIQKVESGRAWALGELEKATVNVETLTGELRQLKADAEELQSQKITLTAQNGELETNVAELKKQVRNLELRVEEIQQESSTSSTAADVRHQELEQTITTLEQRIQSIQSVAERELAQAQKDKQAALEALSPLQTQLQELASKREEKNKMVDEASIALLRIEKVWAFIESNEDVIVQLAESTVGFELFLSYLDPEHGPEQWEEEQQKLAAKDSSVKGGPSV